VTDDQATEGGRCGAPFVMATQPCQNAGMRRQLFLRAHPFELMEQGIKQVEFRPALKAATYEAGDEVLFMCGRKRLLQKIYRIDDYPSIVAAVRAIPPSAHGNTPEGVVENWSRYYTDAYRDGPVRALWMSKIS